MNKTEKHNQNNRLFPQQTNRRMTVRRMTVTALFAALSVVLMLAIRLPFPAAPFLEYDPADIPILLLTFAYGPLWGLALTVVVSVIQGLTVSASSGIIGIVMHIVSAGISVIVVGLICRRDFSRKRALLALVAATLTHTAAMVMMNLILTPIFMGTPVSQVIPMLLPIIIPFNLLKAGGNAAVTFILYRQVANLVTGKEGRNEKTGRNPEPETPTDFPD